MREDSTIGLGSASKLIDTDSGRSLRSRPDSISLQYDHFISFEGNSTRHILL